MFYLYMNTAVSTWSSLLPIKQKLAWWSRKKKLNSAQYNYRGHFTFADGISVPAISFTSYLFCVIPYMTAPHSTARSFT